MAAKATDLDAILSHEGGWRNERPKITVDNGARIVAVALPQRSSTMSKTRGLQRRLLWVLPQPARPATARGTAEARAREAPENGGRATSPTREAILRHKIGKLASRLPALARSGLWLRSASL